MNKTERLLLRDLGEVISFLLEQQLKASPNGDDAVVKNCFYESIHVNLRKLAKGKKPGKRPKIVAQVAKITAANAVSQIDDHSAWFDAYIAGQAAFKAAANRTAEHSYRFNYLNEQTDPNAKAKP